MTDDEQDDDYDIRAVALDAALKCCAPVLCGDASPLIEQARKIEAYLMGKDAPDTPTGSSPWVGTAAALDS